MMLTRIGSISALALASLLLGPTQMARAQETEPPEQNAPAAESDTTGEQIRVRYKEGLELTTADGNWRLHIEWRIQSRFSYPFDENVDAINDLPTLIKDPSRATLEIQRARLRVGGHAYRPWLDYYLEYDFKNARMLGWKLNLRRWEETQFRVGQWEADYNRERRASDRELQLVDRSIVNDYFAIDLQQGLMLFGRLFSGSTADSRYFAAMFSGNGAGEGNDDTHFMWMGRWQWNFWGEEPGLGQSDLGIRERPAASLAVAGAINRSPCTAFKTAGCSQLPGFEEGEAGQYSVAQLVGEYAFKHRGFATQGELHWKRIDDNVNDTRTELLGGYAQLGYFPHAAIPSIPRPLEVALRFASVDPDRAVGDNVLREFTVGASWFFAGHRNKLAADASLFSADSVDGDRGRVRVQWDFSF